MFGILGSGFGLYGYLPALVEEHSQQILLPKRYQEKFGTRSELSRFVSSVHWATDEYSMLDQVNGVALALRPIDQNNWIPKCIKHSTIKYLLLEKPLTQNPESAILVLDQLIHSGKIFRLGYTFRFTNWCEQLFTILRRGRKDDFVQIRWNFLAHHYSHNIYNWKRYNSMGGGAIRFFGIHIIALLAEAGYKQVNYSKAFHDKDDECEKRLAQFSGLDLPDFEVLVDSRSNKNEFRVEMDLNHQTTSRKLVLVELTDPFETTGETLLSEGMDRRVPILSQLCRSLLDGKENLNNWYRDTLLLWKQVEKKTAWILIR